MHALCLYLRFYIYASFYKNYGPKTWQKANKSTQLHISTFKPAYTCVVSSGTTLVVLCKWLHCDSWSFPQVSDLGPFGPSCFFKNCGPKRLLRQHNYTFPHSNRHTHALSTRLYTCCNLYNTMSVNERPYLISPFRLKGLVCNNLFSVL